MNDKMSSKTIRRVQSRLIHCPERILEKFKNANWTEHINLPEHYEGLAQHCGVIINSNSILFNDLLTPCLRCSGRKILPAQAPISLSGSLISNVQKKGFCRMGSNSRWVTFYLRTGRRESLLLRTQAFRL